MKSVNSIRKGVLTGLATVALGLWTSACLADGTNTAKPGPPPKPDKLETCPVSGDKLGEMGKPFEFVYKDREVKLCCPSCKKDFDKDPAKYIKKIEAADKKAKS